MNQNNGLLASICGFFKSVFSSEPTTAPSKAASVPAANDGLTSVERYIRNKAQSGSHLTSVEQYIRTKATSSKRITSVEQYVRNLVQAKPMTGVEKYIQSKA